MIEKQRRQLLLEGVWVIAGQLFSALGAFLGLRLLTEIVAPQVFGEVVLFSGVVLLANGMAAGPLMQGVLRHYPEAAATNSMNVLRKIVNRYLATLTVVTSLACVLGLAVYSSFSPTNRWLWALVILLVILDVIRQRELTLLSAARHQGTAALWVAADVWARPVSALGMISLLGPTTGAVLLGYVVASCSLIVVFKPWFIGQDPVAHSGQDEAALAQRLLRYSIPLMPLGAIGWISGQADRYIIGLLVGVQEAGLYAAAYGIVSRPFLMAGSAAESWLRPVYYEAVVSGDRVREQRIFGAWWIALTGVCALTIAVFIFWHHEIATLMLAPSYRSVSGLMPWIAVGYGFLAIAQVHERVCYAHNDTKGVFVTESLGGMAALVVTVLAVAQFGISGAAYAVPVYFVLQLIVAMTCARRTARRLSYPERECKPCMDKSEPWKQLCGLSPDNQRLA
jgi:O-antigen/teichoic acid export membrane protein